MKIFCIFNQQVYTNPKFSVHLLHVPKEILHLYFHSIPLQTNPYPCWPVPIPPCYWRLMTQTSPKAGNSFDFNTKSWFPVSSRPLHSQPDLARKQKCTNCLAIVFHVPLNTKRKPSLFAVIPFSSLPLSGGCVAMLLQWQGVALPSLVLHRYFYLPILDPVPPLGKSVGTRK